MCSHVQNVFSVTRGSTSSLLEVAARLLDKIIVLTRNLCESGYSFRVFIQFEDLPWFLLFIVFVLVLVQSL